MSFPQNRQLPTLNNDIQLEIIRILLDKHSEERTRNLKVFSLISRSTLEFCQKQIFHRFRTGRSDAENCSLILKSSPHLKTYVKELWFFHEWHILVTHIQPIDMGIIRTLTALNRIGIQINYSICSWRSLKICVRRTITDLILQGGIDSLYLQGLSNIPPAAFGLWKSLKTLEIRDENPNPTSFHLEEDSDFDPDVLPEGVLPKSDEDRYEDFDRLSLFTPIGTIPQGSAKINLQTLCLLDSDKVLLHMLIAPNNLLDEERQMRLRVYSESPPAPSRSLMPSDNNEDMAITTPTVDSDSDSNSGGSEANSEPEESDDSAESNVTDESKTDDEFAIYDFGCKHFTKIFPDRPSDTSSFSEYHFDFSGLRSFTADITLANLRPIWHIIHRAYDSLVELDIRERFRCRSLRDPFGFCGHDFPAAQPIILPEEISFASLVHLRALALTIMIRDPPYMCAMPEALSSWCSLLHTAPPGLRHLKITLDAFYFDFGGYLAHWFVFEGSKDVTDTVIPSPFIDMDEIIASKTYFPALETCSVCVILPEDEHGSYNSEPNDDITTDVISPHDLDAYFEFEHFLLDQSPQLSDDECVSSPSYITSSNEAVRKSVGFIFRLTRRRFSPTQSFFVKIDRDHHVRG
ncbi:hypothetical protein BDN70DRAFT_935989 [Pholiota conissans]|uniref:Uncharacterized protein n=1 Tax=Pholiota conissans TaxID=109636 RepID=A0A9P5YTQ9_9AGAR|nr:hypothetical protein BDN70DRAFT_935989 [Pholiota conissans]